MILQTDPQGRTSEAVQRCLTQPTQCSPAELVSVMFDSPTPHPGPTREERAPNPAHLWCGLDEDSVGDPGEGLEAASPGAGQRHRGGSARPARGHGARRQEGPDAAEVRRQHAGGGGGDGAQLRRLLQVHGHLAADGGVARPAFVLHS